MESIALKAFGNVHTISMPPTMPSSGHTISSPCAGCKFLRRKCQPDCVFAPYFPPDQPTKFSNVHRVFGASNVTKILNDLKPFEREDAVNSLAYEAEMRLRDPVYGCVGIISLLQRRLRELQIDLSHARTELAKYQSAVSRGIGEAEQLQQQRMMMMKGYAAAAAAAAEFGNNGGYDGGLMMAMGMAQSLKRPSSIGGDDDPHTSTLGMFS